MTLGEELIKFSQKLIENRLVLGPGGNTSVKKRETLLISPSGLAFSDLASTDLVEVEINTGKVLSTNGHRPSSEISMHRLIYQKRKDVTAIFHAHPTNLIALSATQKRLEIMYPDSGLILGMEIPHIPYRTPCTHALGEEVASVFENHSDVKVCVLRNHGVVCVANNIPLAYLRTELAENQAEMYLKALSIEADEKIYKLSKSDFDGFMNLEIEKHRQKLLENEKERNSE